jgi:hypothetical protein
VEIVKTLKTLLTLGVIGFGFYALWLVIPCYFHNYQFQDDLEQMARQANYSYKKQDQETLLADVVAKAQSYEIPLEAEQVKVTRMGPDLSIETEYTVHVDLPLYPFDLKFSPSTKNHRV